MKEIGRNIFYEDVDLNLKFDFDDLAKFHGADEEGIKTILLDENGHIKMDVLEELVEVYVNAHITDKFGKDFSLDTMDNTMSISWDIKVKSIKEKHIQKWWDEKNPPEEQVKQKSLEEQVMNALSNPSSIPEGLPEHRK
tara:strand:+ start:420 stop:836 length:417 start_codon:yes stop_codon:yes gene_type:complete